MLSGTRGYSTVLLVTTKNRKKKRKKAKKMEQLFQDPHSVQHASENIAIFCWFFYGPAGNTCSEIYPGQSYGCDVPYYRSQNSSTERNVLWGIPHLTEPGDWPT